MPTFQHGSAFVLKIGTAGTETDITSYVKEVKWPRTVDKAENTTGGASSHQSTPGLHDSALTFSGKYDDGGVIHGILTALLGVAGKSAVYGPSGSATGKVKISSAGYLSKYGPSSNMNDSVDWEAEFTPTPATKVVDGVF